MMGEGLDYLALKQRAMADLRLKTEAAVGLFQLDQCCWDVDQDAGTIAFLRDNGVVARAPVQIIGTYNLDDKSWVWGWDHPSVLTPLRGHAEALRLYGEKNAIAEFTTAKLTCAEDDCWRFTALACHLNAAQGGYRGPTGGPLVFMTYGTMTLSKPGGKT